MSLPGLLSSVAVIVHSIVFSSGNNPSSSSSSSSSSSRSTGLTFGGASSSPQRIFLTGVVTGIGVFWIVNWQQRKFRVIERLRLTLWQSISGKDNNDSSSTSAGNDATSNPAPKMPAKALRQRPVSLQQLEPTATTKKASAANSANNATDITVSTGQRVVVVSPFTAATSALSIVVLTLPPGTELAKSKARGVEFYYVLQGNGQSHVHQAGKSEPTSATLSPGQGWVVDPGKTRWVSNPSSSSSDLIVLRAADDGGWQFEKVDLVVPTQTLAATSLSSTAADLLASGLKQVESMVKTYRVMKDSSKS